MRNHISRLTQVELTPSALENIEAYWVMLKIGLRPASGTELITVSSHIFFFFLVFAFIILKWKCQSQLFERNFMKYCLYMKKLTSSFNNNNFLLPGLIPLKFQCQEISELGLDPSLQTWYSLVPCNGSILKIHPSS